MSDQVKVRVHLLLWAVATGSVSLPANLAAQTAAHPPPRTLGAWIEEARSSPFHGLTVSGTPETPAAALAVDEGVGVTDSGWPLAAPVPDSKVSPDRILGYTALAAFAPMFPGMLAAVAYLDSGAEGDAYAALGLWVLGGMASLVSVPVTAILAGNTSLLRTIAGSALGSVAGAVGGAMATAFPPEGLWTAPVYSLIMAVITTSIAAR